MAKTKKSPYQDQATANALVRYGPETSALVALLKTAQEDYSTRLRQAKSARQFGVGAVQQALPQVAGAYQGAQAAVQPAFAQGGGVEAQALQARLGEAGALANSQLQARRVSAIEGEGAARQQAFRDFTSDRTKITDRAQALTQEQGAFIASQIGDMGAADAAAIADAESQAATLGQSERNSQRSSGIDPDTGLPIPGGKLDPAAKKDGKKWATAEQQGAASDVIQQALREARGYVEDGESRGTAAQDLAQGVPGVKQPVYETVKGVNGKPDTRRAKLNPDGTPVMKDLPGVPQIKSQLLLSAALDMAYDGHLSRRNQKLLHDRGIKLAPLGLVTYAEWDKQRRAARQPTGRPGTAPGSNGQQRPT